MALIAELFDVSMVIGYKLSTAEKINNTMDDFDITFNIFGKNKTFEEWDAEEDRKMNEITKRHKDLTAEDLAQIEEEKDEQNTKKATKWAVKIFNDFLCQKEKDTDFTSYSAVLLNETLRDFYASVQSTKPGGEYSVASLMSIRAGINRHVQGYNIISDAEFKSSNSVFKAILKRYRKNGKDKSVHHPRISETDLEQIRQSPILSPDTPAGLVRKVWFDLQLCLARRGREGNRELRRSSFVLLRDEVGMEYVSLAYNPDTKNHKDPSAPDKENLRGFMFSMPGNPLCPVQSFKKYLSKCPDANAFYLHPKRALDTNATDVWYSREPMGANYLGNMLKMISEEVKFQVG